MKKTRERNHDISNSDVLFLSAEQNAGKCDVQDAKY